MLWPDGGTGMPHKHPSWGKCSHCPAASYYAQLLAQLICNPVTISALLLGLIWLIH